MKKLLLIAAMVFCVSVSANPTVGTYNINVGTDAGGMSQVTSGGYSYTQSGSGVYTTTHVSGNGAGVTGNSYTSGYSNAYNSGTGNYIGAGGADYNGSSSGIGTYNIK